MRNGIRCQRLSLPLCLQETGRIEVLRRLGSRSKCRGNSLRLALGPPLARGAPGPLPFYPLEKGGCRSIIERSAHAATCRRNALIAPCSTGTGLRGRPPRDPISVGELGGAARARHAGCASGTRADASSEAVPALVRALTEGVRASDHARPRTRAAERLRRRARDRARGGIVGRQPIARPVRDARGDDARRCEATRRRARHRLRLPPHAIRRSRCARHRARRGGARVRRRG